MNYEESENVIPGKLKWGDCCNMWVEIPADPYILDWISLRVRLAGFKDVIEHHYPVDNVMLLIRSVIPQKHGLSHSDNQTIIRVTRALAFGERPALPAPPPILQRLEEKIDRGLIDDQSRTVTGRLEATLSQIPLINSKESDERDLVIMYIHRFRGALDRHRKHGHEPLTISEKQIASLIRAHWHRGDTGFLRMLFERFNVVPFSTRKPADAPTPADAPAPAVAPTPAPTKVQQQQTQSLAPNTFASLAGLRAALGR